MCATWADPRHAPGAPDGMHQDAQAAFRFMRQCAYRTRVKARDEAAPAPHTSTHGNTAQRTCAYDITLVAAPRACGLHTHTPPRAHAANMARLARKAHAAWMPHTRMPALRSVGGACVWSSVAAAKVAAARIVDKGETQFFITARVPQPTRHSPHSHSLPRSRQTRLVMGER